MAKHAHEDRPVPVPAASLAQDLAHLTTCDLGELRVQYRNQTGRIAPARISRPLLLRVLAYAMQANLHGDLRPQTRRLLDRLAEAPSPGRAVGTSRVAVVDDHVGLRTGTVLLREWQGRMERVSVVDAGFSWNETRYASLSAVAFAITGTKWNGRRFFGLVSSKGGRTQKADRDPGASIGSAPDARLGDAP